MQLCTLCNIACLSFSNYSLPDLIDCGSGRAGYAGPSLEHVPSVDYHW